MGCHDGDLEKIRKTMVIEDVPYVPGIKSNLLSIRQFMLKGISCDNEDIIMEIFVKNHKLILRASLSKNRTFQTSMNVA